MSAENGQQEGGAKMLRRIVLIACISGGLTGFVLAGPGVALRPGGHGSDVYTGQGSAQWGGWFVSTPSTPLPLADSAGATGAIGGLVLDFGGTKKVTGGTAVWFPPNSTLGLAVLITRGAVGNGTLTAYGTVNGRQLQITLAMVGLNATAVNAPSTTIGTGTVSVTER